MKKLIYFVALFTFSLLLVGCGNNNETTNKTVLSCTKNDDDVITKIVMDFDKKTLITTTTTTYDSENDAIVKEEEFKNDSKYTVERKGNVVTTETTMDFSSMNSEDIGNYQTNKKDLETHNFKCN